MHPRANLIRVQIGVKIAIYIVSYVRNGERVASVPERLTLSRAEKLSRGLTMIAGHARLSNARAIEAMGELGLDFDYAIVD